MVEAAALIADGIRLFSRLVGDLPRPKSCSEADPVKGCSSSDGRRCRRRFKVHRDFPRSPAAKNEVSSPHCRRFNRPLNPPGRKPAGSPPPMDDRADNFPQDAAPWDAPISPGGATCAGFLRASSTSFLVTWAGCRVSQDGRGFSIARRSASCDWDSSGLAFLLRGRLVGWFIAAWD